MKAYLDNSVVSAIVKEDFSPSVNEALKQIMDSFEEGRLELMTSKVTLEEIERYRGPKRPDLDVLYDRLGKVPFAADNRVVGFHSNFHRYGGSSYPLVEDHPTSSALRQMGLERIDAHHLTLAIDGGCDVFVACDNHFLRISAKIGDRFKIRLMTPEALAAELS